MTVVINGTTGITSVNGSAAAPSVTGADTDTGIVYGTNTLSLATGGTTAVTVDSSQNVGIGTSSPAANAKLSVAGNIYIGGNVVVGSPSGGTNGSCNLSGGNAFSGGTGAAMSLRGYTNGYNNGGMEFYYGNGTTTIEAARIDSSGNLLVGNTSAGYARFETTRSDTGNVGVGRFLASAASGYTGEAVQIIATQAGGTGFNLLSCYYSGGGAYAFKVRGDGTIYAQNTTVQSASDARFKENIVDSTQGLDVVSTLRPVRFDIKEGHGVSAKTNQLGFIAQEVQAVFPDAVDIWGESDDPENPYLSLGSTALIPVLVKAIQEQQAIIEQLRADVEALKAA